jgi:hypothetical protein
MYDDNAEYICTNLPWAENPPFVVASRMFVYHGTVDMHDGICIQTSMFTHGGDDDDDKGTLRTT